MFKAGLPTTIERATASTEISAEQLEFQREQSTVFSGAVEMQRGDQWLGSDRLVYWHESGQYASEGPVRYQDSGLRLTAGHLRGDQAKDRLDLRDVRYQMAKDNGNGVAEQATIDGQMGRLRGASYSTCPPSTRQWEVTAEEIHVDQEAAMATVRNATLRLGQVPILWLPYGRFPTDDRRRSGLLMPKLGYNEENGIDLSLPIYLNLAPNYDATLLPRVLGERGLMLGGEFRYLTQRHAGELEAHWLDDDKYVDNRHYLEYQHTSRFTRHWSARAHLRDVSDVDYFQDFGESSVRTATTLLESNAGLYGRGLGWSASLRADRWQIASPLLDPGTEPYRRLPRAQLDWQRPLLSWLQSGIAAEAVRFQHDERSGGNRFDLRPWLRGSFGGSWWFANPEIAWRYTGYSLDEAVPGGFDRSPSRELPIASFDAGLVFERSLEWGGQPLLQTLEPRLYYLNVPYRDHAAIPLFDTRELSFGWPGLFRDNSFAGADRQSDANQATVALSTRIFGANDGRERLSASLGRIVYFDAPRVGLDGELTDEQDGSAWVGELNLAFADNWDLGLHQQWDSDQHNTLLSAARVQWRYRPGGLVNFAYRYRDELLEQTDLSFIVPINPQWRLVGRWNHSLRDRRSLESMAGVEWKSCCVALRVMARRYIRNADAEQNLGLYVELELNGVGNFGRDTGQLLDNAILGYSR